MLICYIELNQSDTADVPREGIRPISDSQGALYFPLETWHKFEDGFRECVQSRKQM